MAESTDGTSLTGQLPGNVNVNGKGFPATQSFQEIAGFISTAMEEMRCPFNDGTALGTALGTMLQNLDSRDR